MDDRRRNRPAAQPTGGDADRRRNRPAAQPTDGDADRRDGHATRGSSPGYVPDERPLLHSTA
jgi:hypothetical protein